MIKKIGILSLCIILMLSTFIVLINLPFVNAPPDRKNTCPTVSNPTIANQSADIDIDLGWFNITISDADGNNTYGNITCSNGNTFCWSNQTNGTKYLELDTLEYSTNYTVFVNITSDYFVNYSFWFITEDFLDTSVNTITTYWKNAVPEVNIYATDNSVKADNITLYYRWSSDNISWNVQNWTLWVGVNNPRNLSIWSFKDTVWVWTFDCPNKSGYYEFYSIGANNSIYEIAPSVADARCHVNYSNLTRFGYKYPGLFGEAWMKDWIRGSNFKCPSNGTADNITCWIEVMGHKYYRMKCAIYENHDLTLIGQTEEKNISFNNGWIVFNFTGNKPFLTAGVNYILVGWAEGGFAYYDNYINSDYEDLFNIIETPLNYTSNFPANFTGHNIILPGFVYSIYCRYTVNETPMFGMSSPANGSTGNPLKFNWNISINDPEGDVFDWAIQCSNRQINSTSDETNGTKSLSLSGLEYSTTYKVWVSAIDPAGSGLYTRRWYTFTTIGSKN